MATTLKNISDSNFSIKFYLVEVGLGTGTNSPTAITSLGLPVFPGNPSNASSATLYRVLGTQRRILNPISTTLIGYTGSVIDEGFQVRGDDVKSISIPISESFPFLKLIYGKCDVEFPLQNKSPSSCSSSKTCDDPFDVDIRIKSRTRHAQTNLGITGSCPTNCSCETCVTCDSGGCGVTCGTCMTCTECETCVPVSQTNCTACDTCDGVTCHDTCATCACP